jgi:hypothetical protein
MEYMFVGHPLGAMMVPWYDGAMGAQSPLRLPGEEARGANFEKRPHRAHLPQRQSHHRAGEALERSGFKRVINVLYGFEGELDEAHHRNSKNGWRVDGLAVGAVLKPTVPFGRMDGVGPGRGAVPDRVLPARGARGDDAGAGARFRPQRCVARQPLRVLLLRLCRGADPTGLWRPLGTAQGLAAGAALTAAGTVLFAFAHRSVMANAGRLAIGAAAGVAFVAMMKLATHWMPARQFRFATALALFIGHPGRDARRRAAASRGRCVRLGARDGGERRRDGVSRGLPSGSSCATIPPSAVRELLFERLARGARALDRHRKLRDVSRYPVTWAMLVVSRIVVRDRPRVAGLWGVPFLVTQHGFTPRAAASLASAMLVIWALGGLAFAWISQRAAAAASP